MNIDIQKQQEHIQEDLQSMQSSLEVLKKSLDQDAALATKQECLSLMKDIVQQMTKVDSSQHMLDLQKKLESSNVLSSEILQEIVQSFISLKLAYTESAVDVKAEQLLEKYSGLVTKKFELDNLLASLTQEKSYQIDPTASHNTALGDKAVPLSVDKEDGWLMKNTKAIFSKEEWQKDWKSNALRTASGLAIVGGVVWGAKKLWSRVSDDKNEKSDAHSSDKKKGMSWWKKSLLAVGGVGVGRGLWKNKDRIMEILGLRKGLSFEDAMSKVEGDVRNISEKNIKTGFDGIVYDESGGLIKSYNQELMIDKSKKKINGLDMKFSDYEQLIFTANFINAVKRNYAGKCPNNAPFSLDRGGDLMINTNDTGQSKNVEVMSGGFFSTLAKYAPDVDGGVWSKIFGGGKEGRAKLQAYLNRLDIWKSSDAPLQENPDLPSTHAVQNDIVNTKPELQHGGSRGSIETYKIPGSDNKYDIKAYDGSVLVEYKEGVGYRIDGLDISFKDDAEVIRVATFINKMKYEFPSKGSTVTPFSYEMEYLDKGIWIDTTKEREGGWLKGILTNKINVLERTTIKDKMPTVWQGSNINHLVTYLNTLRKEDGSSWWQQ